VSRKTRNAIQNQYGVTPVSRVSKSTRFKSAYKGARLKSAHKCTPTVQKCKHARDLERVYQFIRLNTCVYDGTHDKMRKTRCTPFEKNCASVSYSRIMRTTVCYSKISSARVCFSHVRPERSCD